MAETFRFEEASHRYSDEAGRIPNITTMLEQTGYVDPSYYTEEGKIRGTAVHDLTRDYDLGALNLVQLVSAYRPYVLHYAETERIVRPRWRHVEVFFVHVGYRFAGRPDRVGELIVPHAVAEIKSGARHKSHGVQLALQAILVAPVLGVPAHLIGRFVFYAGPTKCKVEQLCDPNDFAKAREVIRTCCGI